MKYPLVKQHSLKDCGPCSLASIIMYYKGYVSVDTLAYMMNTTKEGTSAYDIVVVAKKLGFKARGVRTDNLEELTLPCICHVIIDNKYQHYVVLYNVDYKRKRVLIADPASGKKYYSFDEFYKIWNFVNIELIPLKQIPKFKNYSLLKYMFKLYKNNFKTFITIILSSYNLMVITLIYTYLIKNIIDNIYNIDLKLITLFIISYIFKIVASYFSNYCSIQFIKTVDLKITNEIISHLLHLPYPYYSNYTTGEIISRYNDVESLKITINDFLSIIVELPIIIVMIIYSFMIDSYISLILVILLSLYLIIYYFVNKHFLLQSINYRNKKADFYTRLNETLKAYESIRAINITNTMFNKLVKNNEELESCLHKNYNYQNLKCLLQDMFLLLITSIIFIIGRVRYNTIIILYFIYSYIFSPLSNIVDFIIKYNEFSYTYKKVDEFNIKENIGHKIPLNYDIVFRNLNYAYGIKKVLTNVNLKIKYGSKVFIMGESGSGKSTLAKLIKGFYKTSNLYLGETKINKCLKEKIIYVGQNEYLFTDTIYDNLFNDNKDINSILKACLVNKEVTTFLEDNAFNISGGEKARICVARALLRNFEILILDEALEEVDVNMERVILKNIFELYHNKTIIVISHRLNNLDLFNMLIKVENGQVKETNYI